MKLPRRDPGSTRADGAHGSGWDEATRALLAGLDGLDGPEGPGGAEVGEPVGTGRPRPATPLRLAPDAAAVVRREIARAGGREVCFLADVEPGRTVVRPRAVARGNFDAVFVAARDADVGGVMLHNHPSGVLEPSEADLGVAAQLYERGLGTAIVANDAGAMYVVVEPPVPRVRTPLDAAALDAVLAPGGALSGAHAGYEDRPGQRLMLRVVGDRYNEGGIAVVEAGTGIGKSLAYLLPAVAWAAANGERTVVSTNTINLQEQLAGKDLPLVRDLLGEDVEWALIKGRGNYVSIRRALLAAESAATLFEDDRSREMHSLLEWIEGTDDGSLSDLPFTPAPETWEEVQSDPDMCMRARCPHFQACFYQRSRRRAAAAQILVVNHHLLFSDLSVRRATGNYTQAAVLPAYRHVILDEAHNLEDAATEHLGVVVTRRALFRSFSRLDRRGRGILSVIQESLSAGGASAELRERIETRVRPALSRVRAEAELFVDAVEKWVPAGRSTVRLGEDRVGEPVERDDVRERLAGLVATLGALERELGEVRARSDLEQGLGDHLEARLLDLRSVERRLSALRHGVGLVLTPGEAARSFVRWAELRGRGKRINLVLAAAPIDLGPLLRDSFFGKVQTAVLTSATLSTRHGFDFLRGRLGLDAGSPTEADEALHVEERIVPSPFDFTRQTVLAVPTDLPDVRSPGDAFLEAGARVVEGLAAVTDGGLFVLFTSHAALRRVAELLRHRAVDARWPLYVQGEDDRHRLLARFVEAERGILLGTSSFWEGVDVPGHPLRGLVIHKLPFRVPTEPITAARMEALERAGGDPFGQFMLPHAALRLKQGFGRLIRSREDHGAVVVLDDRILTRRYGRYLRESLPDAPLIKGPWVELTRRLAVFYGAA